MKKLKTIRIVLSVVLLLLFTLLVADISGVLPYEAHRLERMQFVPALLSMGIGIDAFWLVFAFTFGRLYCSSVCPLGTVQDIDGLVSVTRRKEAEFGRPILFFSDCVQAFGKAELRLSDWALDAASFSAHKIHGPRGVGLLYLKKGQIQSLSHAGGQEKGVRGGTENLPAIASFTVAAEELAQRDDEEIRRLNDIVRTGLEGTKYSILTPRGGSTPYILTIAGPLPSEVAMRMLQDRGFLLSSGSACSNNERGKAEAIFRASGFAKSAGGALRISFSHDNTPEEAQLLVEALKEIG